MGPLLTKLKKLVFPDKAPAPTPAPQPEPAPVPEPTAPDVKPSAINAVNYIRALMVLRNIDFAKLRAEFSKLPLRQLGIIFGLLLWCALTYWVFHLVTGGIPLK